MIDPQEFGKLQAQFEAVSRTLDRVIDRLDRMDSKIDAIENQLAEAKGGWRMLMLLGGGGAAIGSAVTAYLGKALKFFV